MNVARYYLAVALLVGIPPACLYWLLVHPFITLWRRLGAGWSYLVVGTLCIVMGVLLFHFRELMLTRDLGTNWLLVTAGAIGYGISIWIEILCRRMLPARTLAGLPEIREERDQSTLLTEGIYARVRHPRYLSGIVGIGACALIANYVTTYLLFLAFVPTLYVIARLEERELVERFGEAYQKYRQETSMFLPRRDP